MGGGPACVYMYAQVPSADLERLIKASTVNFRDKNVTPVVKTGEYWTLELFHGPTFAFKVSRDHPRPAPC